MAYAPANDPFVITVGALDLHNSTNPDRADAAPWSAWGYTLDGFAKPELSAPGRAITGPVPAGSTLAAEKPAQVIRTPGGTYMTLSGTSLSTPIVSGIAAALLTLNPTLSPDQVKGALMLKARALRKVTNRAAGVGEAYAPGAAAVQSPPNPNRALDAFLVPDPEGDGLVFDDVSWLDAAKGSLSWDAVSWLDVSWSDAAWSLRLVVGRLLERRLVERRLVVGCLLGRRLLERRLLGRRARQRLRRRRALSRLLAQAFQQPQRALVPRHAVGDTRLADAAAVRQVPVVGLAERLFVREPRREAEQALRFAVST